MIAMEVNATGPIALDVNEAKFQCPLLGVKRRGSMSPLLRRSLRLNVGELYYLPPLRGFGCDEGTEFGWRTRKCRTT